MLGVEIEPSFFERAIWGGPFSGVKWLVLGEGWRLARWQDVPQSKF